MRGLAVALALAGVAACGSKRDAPSPPAVAADAAPGAVVAASGDAAPTVAPPPTEPPAEPASTEPLTYRTQLPACAVSPSIPAGYAAALAAGRAAAKQHRWVDAVAALTRAQADRADDPISASELSWALLMVGDPVVAYQAVKPALDVRDRKLAAAAQYHAARAAEAQGWLDIAADHYTNSLALREDDAVGERFTALGDARPTPVPAKALLAGCRHQLTADDACACLRSDLSRLPGGGAGTGSCTWATPSRAGGPARVRVAMVSGGDRAWLVLVAERGGQWSALTAATASPGAAPVSIGAVGDLVAVEATTTRDTQTETHLSICRLPVAPTEAATCFDDVPVAQWTTDDQCRGRAFKVMVTDGGIVTKRLLAGADPDATGDPSLLGP